MSKNIRFRGQNFKIQIWDSEGQEKYRDLIPSYVKNSSKIFIVCDVSNSSSWIYFVKNMKKQL